MLAAALTLLLLNDAGSDADTAPGPVETVEVRSTASQRNQAAIVGIDTLDDAEITWTAPTHPNELFDRIPGAWISRGSGQESLAALRSPVLSGAGACGAFMIIEDRVPIRPAGFCNVNELFEVNLTQATRIDVLRGPGSVIYGSNALHGVIDVSSADPDPARGWDLKLEAGSDDFYRGLGYLSGENLALSFNYGTSRSFRVDESWDLAQANLVWLAEAAGAEVRTSLALADLGQETAGYVLGEDAYKDPVLRVGNDNPEAYRNGDAWRLVSRWAWNTGGDGLLEAIAYARGSSMDFRQHFLPGKPLEDNDQQSAGLMLAWSPGGPWRAGLDFEWADGTLVEYQDGPTEGSAFLQATRPQGYHYDYDVRQWLLAAWGQWQFDLDAVQTITAGVRAEYLAYDYDNRMLDGNTKDDGTPCGFGGCLYRRPADRHDSYISLAPELGYNRALEHGLVLRARIARGFRAPQATELYRLQSGQAVADIDAETLDAAELGLEGSRESFDWAVTAYVMRKRHFIFRDAEGYNVSDGKTRHHGIEARFDAALSERWQLSGNLAWARHEYAFNRDAAAGEIIRDGNTVDTAPEWLWSLRLRFLPSAAWDSELAWVQTGSYWVDAANEHDYPGQGLLNARLSFTPGDGRHRFGLRVTNVLDDLYAERGDFAFGNFRYFPGAERRYYFEWTIRAK